MRPKSFKINNQGLDDAVSVRFRQVNPGRGGGYPGGPSPSAYLEVQRETARKPTSLGFGLGTNRDGTLATFSGAVQLQNAQGEDTYLIEFEDGYLESWQLIAPEDPTRPAREVWLIRIPDLKVTVEGKPIAMKVSWLVDLLSAAK